MTDRPRVFITGIGIVAPSGLGHARFWDAIVNGKPLIGPITRFDASSYACRIGGQVDDTLLDEFIDARKQRTTSHATRLALVAAELALRDAHLELSSYAPESIGVCIGTALGGWIDGEQQYAVLLERGAKRVNPFIVSGAGNHGPGIEIASAIGAEGPQVTFSSGCPSSLQALGYAASLIRDGTVDICLAGGTDSPLSPMVVAALNRTQELSTTNDDPASAARPFDSGRNGMVLSEGSCFLILESERCAINRGADICAEFVGSSTSCDARGLYGMDSDAHAGGRALHGLLRANDLTAADINYVCAHANGSPAFDRKEAAALHKALGEFAARTPVSSIKGVLGHAFGAAGTFQAATCVLALRNGLIPPTFNLEVPDADCGLSHVIGQAYEFPVTTAIATGYGYGGVNAYVAIRQSPHK
jgi:act minimal PKS ketosynthase (KS/KS alpha)